MGEWNCACGTNNSGLFCKECGSKRPSEEETEQASVLINGGPVNMQSQFFNNMPSIGMCVPQLNKERQIPPCYTLPRPGDDLPMYIDYYSSGTSALMRQDSYEIVASKYSETLAQIDIYTRKSGNDGEFRKTFRCDISVINECMKIIEEGKIEEWPKLNNTGIIGGNNIVLKFRKGDDIVRVPSDYFPMDYKKWVEEVHSILASKATLNNAVYDKGTISIYAGERIKLEPLCRKHLEDYFAYAGDLETTKYMAYLPMDDKEITNKFLKCCEEEWYKDNQIAYEFAIMLGEKNIGEISVYRYGDKAELGWILNRDYMGMGYAGEAAAALIGYAKAFLNMNNFFAYCDTENEPSYKLMEKLGMKRISESDGRKNKQSDEERRQYLYELKI